MDQRRRFVLAYTRLPKGEWSRAELTGDGGIPLAGLETTLRMDDVYDDVPLPPLAVGEEQEWEDYAETASPD